LCWIGRRRYLDTSDRENECTECMLYEYVLIYRLGEIEHYRMLTATKT